MDMSRADRAMPGVQPTLMWRLLAANNRAIGRSSRAYAVPDEVLAAAEAVKAAVDDLTWQVERISPAPAWRWTAAVDGQLVAVGSHHYRRRIECHRGFEQFRECLTSAEIDGGGWFPVAVPGATSLDAGAVGQR